MMTVPNSSPDQDGAARDASWWAGYAQALKDFPHGISEAVQANRQTLADLLARIERGPVASRPALRLITGGAA